MSAESFLDRNRASRLMRAAGVDAMLVLQPENFQYVTGASAGVAALFRRAGAALALIPVDASAPAGAIVSDHALPGFRARSPITDVRSHTIWVESIALAGALNSSDIRQQVLESNRAAGRRPGFARPETFDWASLLDQLHDMLQERGLSQARIGLELNWLAVADYESLQRRFPGVRWVNVSRLIDELRMFKCAAEIALLEQGAQIAEAGILHMLKHTQLGRSRDELAQLWRDGAQAESERRGVNAMKGAWEYISVGPDPWGPGAVVRQGDIIKVDVGCLLSGYSSDSARTYAVGQPHPAAVQVHAALRQAFDAGLQMLQPGRAMAEVHRAATGAMREAGFSDFSRGHFGHGLGQNVFSEEWPFLSATSSVDLQPGMVLAFETPYYIKGLGGFIIEDQFLITEDGHRCMNTLPRELSVIGAPD